MNYLWDWLRKILGKQIPPIRITLQIGNRSGQKHKHRAADKAPEESALEGPSGSRKRQGSDN